MSSRAVRKATGHTIEDDLAQVLEKVGISKNDNDDDECDLMTTTTKANNQRLNTFEMLADDDEEESVNENVTGDNDNSRNEIQQKSSVSKTRRKRKAKKKNGSASKNDTNDDDNEFLLDVKEFQQEPVADSVTLRESFMSLLSVDTRLLNPTNEMKKRFGSSIVEQIERESNLSNQMSAANMLPHRRRAHVTLQQRPTTRIAKHNAFIAPKAGWPPYFKLGLLMKPTSPLSDTNEACGNYFQFEYDKDYQRLQVQFYDSVDQHNLQGIMDILRSHPYHIESLLHLSDVSRIQDDTPTAVDLMERALYSFQQSFHPLFSITRGECRMEYRIQANRSFFISLFKHIIFVGERGCSRTALEFCKVLLSLNPIEDPMAILLLLDHYAIRSLEYHYLIQFYNEQNRRLNLSGLPNFAFSLALAHFHTSSFENANEMLQDALIRFPSVLKYLLDKLSIRPDRTVERCRYFSDSDQHETSALKCVQQLYVVRMSTEWKEKDELEFLKNNVNEVVRIVEANADPRINEYTRLRETSYRRTPINICRHIVLSESNEIRGFLPNDLENDGRFYNVDPFPPSDSIASFQRPERPTMQIHSSYNGYGMLLRSLFPNFNLENFLAAPDAQAAAAAAAVDDDQNDAGILHALQESIRDFIRDIGITNIGEDQPQQQPPNNDDGDDDNDHNNSEFD